MSVEDGAKLYDVCPHVSDSVCNHELLSVTSGSSIEQLLVRGQIPFQKAHVQTEMADS